MLQRLKNWLGFGRRSLENPATPLNTPWYGPPTLSGIAINEWTADTYSAFWCAVRTISVDAASLKYQPVKDGEQGGVVPATDHWSYRLVTHSPDGERPAHRFWATLFQHGLTWGNGYAYIRRKKSSEGYKLELLPPNQVIPRTDSTTFYYQYVGEGDIPKRIMPFNMIHLANPMSFDGRVGKSIVQTARESIGLGLGADLSMAAWYGNAVRPGGHYKIQPGLPEKAQANLREYVDALHAGPLNNGRPGIHPPGLEWMPDTLPAPDDAYLRSREFQIQEMARWFNVPPTTLGDYSRSTHSNLEQARMDYVSTGVKPWADGLIGELNLKLFTALEELNHSVRANYHELMATDTLARTAYFASGRQWGYLSVNDVRHAEGKNGIGPAGDIYLSPANMVTDKQLLLQQTAPIPEPTQQPASPDPATQNALLDILKAELKRALRREHAALKRHASKQHF